jgi:hypothetical protein
MRFKGIHAKEGRKEVAEGRKEVADEGRKLLKEGRKDIKEGRKEMKEGETGDRPVSSKTHDRGIWEVPLTISFLKGVFRVSNHMGIG